MRARLIFAITLSIAVLAMLGGASASQASPTNPRILVVNNIPEYSDFLAALGAEPGVAAVDNFDGGAGTPSATSLATYDLVVSLGDSNYQDPALWGDRLADYIDAGGVVIQYAYDNWENDGAHPTGRYESGGYAPFVPGPDDALMTSLGTILVPDSPLLAGVTAFTTTDNTTPTVALGATLLAKLADDRNAIATKGHVVSVAASPQNGSFAPMSAASQLAVNAVSVLGPKPPGPPTGQTPVTPAKKKKCKKHKKKHKSSAQSAKKKKCKKHKKRK